MRETEKWPDYAMGTVGVVFVLVAMGMVFDSQAHSFIDTITQIGEKIREFDAGKLLILGQQWSNKITEAYKENPDLFQGVWDKFTGGLN